MPALAHFGPPVSSNRYGVLVQTDLSSPVRMWTVQKRRLTGRRLAINWPPRGWEYGTVLWKARSLEVGACFFFPTCLYKYVGPIAPMYVRYSYRITVVSSLSLSVDAKTGKNPVFLLLSYQFWLHLVLYGIAGPFPYTWHSRQAMLLDLGCSEVVQRMIIAGFPPHENGPPQLGLSSKP